MSLSGQDGPMLVWTLPMPRADLFAQHVHDDFHQLAWAERGVLWVETAGGVWVLPPTRALLVPARVPHTTGTRGPALLCSVFLRPETCPIEWSAPTALVVTPLLRELIRYLARPDLAAGSRERAEAVVFDLLEPIEVGAVLVPMPADDRARKVAAALLADPADDRGLDAWGRTAGASGRTLSRLFEAETGMSFGRWRTQARMRAALGHLAEGVPVTVTAHRVGYATPSAFVAVFRRTFGMPPTEYFNAP